MKRHFPLLPALLGGTLLIGAAVAQVSPPTITSLSATSLPRSGRLLINGSGFGSGGAGSRVEIGGLAAPFTRWTDTLIAAYVPEATPVGATSVQVFAAGVPSNTLSLTVTLRQPNGRVRWRFQADSDYILQRPAVGADGTVVAHDSAGYVYALTPDGGLKWIFNKTRVFADGPPSIGADGTVYVSDSSTVTAIGPDGSLKWTFTEPQGGRGVMAGPTVGPDGNIYVATDVGGLGVFALSPAGELLWSNPGTPVVAQRAETGAEVVFGPSHAGGPVDQLYLSFDDYGSDARDHLYAFTLTGTQAWQVPLYMSFYSAMEGQPRPVVGPDGSVLTTATIATGGFWSLNAFDPATGALRNSYFPTPGNGMSAPSVGSDGNVYFGHTSGYLQSVDAAFSSRWQVFDGSIILYPIVSPANDQVVTASWPANGVPGSARSFSSTTGQQLWSVDLGVENGGNQGMESRPRFAADGRTVYFGTVIQGPAPGDVYCYLYAVDTSAPSPVPPNAPTSLAASPGSSGSGKNLKVFVSLSWKDNSSNETSFVVERCTGSSCTSFSQIATTNANATAYKDSALARGTTYRYRVKARGTTGDSAYSNIATATTR